MKQLEELKKTLVTDNSRLRTELMNSKSLTAVDYTVTRDLNLTQKVESRLFLTDPVKYSGHKKPFDFVDMDDVTDWLEDAVVRSGKVTAKENSEDGK